VKQVFRLTRANATIRTLTAMVRVDFPGFILGFPQGVEIFNTIGEAYFFLKKLFFINKT
jgi:hypothetical protein